MTVTDRVLDALGEGLRRQAGSLLRTLAEALLTRAEKIESVVSGEDGWALAFDLDRTPYPGWLGQLAGVPATDGTLAQQRDRVRSRGSTRGTPAAIRAAARLALIGEDPVVTLLERDTSAYHFTVRTYEAQTPSAEAVRVSVLAVKPAGLQFDVTVAPGQSWGDLAERGLTFGDLAQYTNEQIRTAIPGRPIT